MLKSVIVIIIFVVIKAIFLAADTAFLYCNPYKISQDSKKNLKAKQLKRMLQNKIKFSATIEIGITMVELLSSAYAAETFVQKMSTLLIENGITSTQAIPISVITVAIILSYVLLIFGGILPRRIARNNPEKVAYRLITTFEVLSVLNIPFEKLIEISTNIFSTIFMIKKEPEQKLTEKEIKMIISEGKDQGLINSIEKEIAERVLRFDNTKVKKIMVPKEKIIAIGEKDKIEKVWEKVKKYKLTRIPVFEKKTEKPLGFINIKDLIIEYASKKEIQPDLEKFIRKIMIINEEEIIDKVFIKMQKNNQAMAIVENNKQEIVGLITLEDIIEKIVGKINDEYDEQKS